mmetsp:Transcript_80486/g.232590  ORF Transcript_80486/g.232590 Transcript_80486/m.232590 type:complete len:223 (+) Transcript_80486:328-996(+)
MDRGRPPRSNMPILRDVELRPSTGDVWDQELPALARRRSFQARHRDRMPCRLRDAAAQVVLGQTHGHRANTADMAVLGFEEDHIEELFEKGDLRLVQRQLQVGATHDQDPPRTVGAQVALASNAQLVPPRSMHEDHSWVFEIVAIPQIPELDGALILQRRRASGQEPIGRREQLGQSERIRRPELDTVQHVPAVTGHWQGVEDLLVARLRHFLKVQCAHGSQ